MHTYVVPACLHTQHEIPTSRNVFQPKNSSFKVDSELVAHFCLWLSSLVVEHIFKPEDVFREPKLCILMAVAELGVRELDNLMAWGKKNGAWRQERDMAIRTRTCACIRIAWASRRAHHPLLANPGSLKMMACSCCFPPAVPNLRYFYSHTFKQPISFISSPSALNSFKNQESRVFVTIQPSWSLLSSSEDLCHKQIYCQLMNF